jgi:hypothetical protein
LPSNPSAASLASFVFASLAFTSFDVTSFVDASLVTFASSPASFVAEEF